MNRLCCDNIEVVGEEYNASDPYLNLAKNVICRGHNSSKLGPEIVLQNCVPHGHHGSGAIWASWIRCHMVSWIRCHIGIMDRVPRGHRGPGAA